MSNWTALGIWQYIHLECIEIVDLYREAPRSVVEPYGTLICVDDERLVVQLISEQRASIQTRWVRFRTLGCYPLTGAVESHAQSLPEIIQEMLLTRTSERQGRIIDHDQEVSMEKKIEGYF